MSYHQEYITQHLRVSNNIKEFWNYVQAQVGQLKSNVSHNDSVAKIQKILDMTSEYKRSLLIDMNELISIEGSNTLAEEQNQRLGRIVQARLKHIQNTKDCATARKVSCTLNHACGFGCILHHVTLCLLIAYGTNRTLILDSSKWNYDQSGKKGWEELFEPLSNTCRSVGSSASITYWPDYDPLKDVIKLQFQTYNRGPGFRPRAVPSDIANSLVHGEPTVWWVGQFVRYIFRPNHRLSQILSAHEKRISYEHPVVGVHIRRTDKIGTEAAEHSVDEYMKQVIEYYEQLSLIENVTRRVYVATDERGVIDEIQRKYPKYKILADPNIAANASVKDRYTSHGLLGIITDLYFLSKSDFLVCTFSSQICRIAYELRNAEGPKDYSQAYRSLDDIWYFAGGSSHVQVALLPHEPRGPEEISLAVEDKILPAGNHWDGYCLGTNIRTGKTGLYPAFKVQSQLETYDGFPAYTDVS